jgi:D-alanine-D-alanine ligase
VKILVLAGGDSNEREVSLDSGAAVCRSLQRLGHEVRALDPATGAGLLDADGKFLLPGVRGSAETADAAASNLIVNTLTSDTLDADLVFIALHGGGGENGSIQNLLDLAGIKYTGSGMAASAVAMNKALTKRLMTSLGVATPEWRLIKVNQDTDLSAEAAALAEELAPPLIVKPNDGGSTIGLTKVTDQAALAEALRIAANESNQILAEQYVEGRELTVAVFSGRAFPVVEIKPVSGLYDYEAKYTKGKSEYIAPAEIDDAIAERLQKAATEIYREIGCEGLVRVDFILDSESRFFCLELNTLPGMTELSLSPMAMKCEGIDFDQLVKMIVEAAQNR